MNRRKTMKGSGAIVMMIAVGILILVAAVGIVIQKQNVDQRIQKQAKEASTVAEATPPTQPSPAQKTITASDTSDEKLDTDFSDIDASINAINADAAAIDTGLNDQMGDLSE